jgi:membrane protease subunit HflK
MSVDQENRPETMATRIYRVLLGLSAFLPSRAVLVFIVFLAWILSGVFVVGPDQIGVVKTLGRKARSEKPGVHYHLPYPISSVLKARVGQIQRLEFGFREAGPGEPWPYEPVREESLMLTGDGNLVDLWFIVQYRISDGEKFLFRVNDPEQTIRAAAEAVMGEVVGRNGLDQVLTVGKQAITQDVSKELQTVLDNYGSGVKVTAVQLQAVDPPHQVRDAFKQVVSAREEKNKMVHEARSYANEVVPVARGEAAGMVLAAETYREERLKKAQGEAARFTALLEEYRKAEEVTRSRLYLEGMEEVLSRAGRIVLDPKDRNVLPLLDMADPASSPSPGPTVEHQGSN